MPKGREAVLIGFNPETTKQYRIYAPDLGRCIKSLTVTFFKDIKGREIDLKLKSFTLNKLITRNPTKRPVAIPIITDLIAVQTVSPSEVPPKPAQSISPEAAAIISSPPFITQTNSAPPTSL